MAELKHLDLTKSSFMADGTEYFIARGLTVARFMEFEKLQIHVGFGMDFKAMYDGLVKAYKHLDKNEQNEPRIILNNLINGIKEKMDNRLHPALQMCTLFIYEKGEDMSDWNIDQATIKIEKWNNEGYDVSDFFQLAVNLVDGFIQIYDQLSQHSSEQPPVESKKKSGKRG